MILLCQCLTRPPSLQRRQRKQHQASPGSGSRSARRGRFASRSRMTCFPSPMQRGWCGTCLERRIWRHSALAANRSKERQGVRSSRGVDKSRRAARTSPKRAPQWVAHIALERLALAGAVAGVRLICGQLCAAGGRRAFAAAARALALIEANDRHAVPGWTQWRSAVPRS
jgi:hypothetical protein